MSEEQKRFKSAAEILAAHDLPREEVWVEEWRTWVCVQGMTGTERDAFEADTQSEAGVNLENIRAKLVARSVIDPGSGELLFSEKQITALGKKSALALQKVFVVARNLSGLSKNDIEELEKNSASAPNDNSGSN